MFRQVALENAASCASGRPSSSVFVFLSPYFSGHNRGRTFRPVFRPPSFIGPTSGRPSPFVFVFPSAAGAATIATDESCPCVAGVGDLPATYAWHRLRGRERTSSGRAATCACGGARGGGRPCSGRAASRTPPPSFTGTNNVPQISGFW